MARPQKHSRKIAVAGRAFRWHLSICEDEPWNKRVAVLADGNPNGSCLEAALETESVTPALVRRVVEAGLAGGWDPDEGISGSRSLSPDQALKCSAFFKREIAHGGRVFTWKVETKGGWHFEIRGAIPEGQLLATTSKIGLEDLNNEMVASLIDAALAQGWEPDRTGLDCFWLDPPAASDTSSGGSNQQPTTNNQQPTTNNQQPTTNNQ